MKFKKSLLFFSFLAISGTMLVLSSCATLYSSNTNVGNLANVVYEIQNDDPLTVQLNVASLDSVSISELNQVNEAPNIKLYALQKARNVNGSITSNDIVISNNATGGAYPDGKITFSIRVAASPTTKKLFNHFNFFVNVHLLTTKTDISQITNISFDKQIKLKVKNIRAVEKKEFDLLNINQEIREFVLTTLLAWNSSASLGDVEISNSFMPGNYSALVNNNIGQMNVKAYSSSRCLTKGFSFAIKVVLYADAVNIASFVTPGHQYLHSNIIDFTAKDIASVTYEEANIAIQSNDALLQDVISILQKGDGASCAPIPALSPNDISISLLSDPSSTSNIWNYNYTYTFSQTTALVGSVVGEIIEAKIKDATGTTTAIELEIAGIDDYGYINSLIPHNDESKMGVNPLNGDLTVVKIGTTPYNESNPPPSPIVITIHSTPRFNGTGFTANGGKSVPIKVHSTGINNLTTGDLIFNNFVSLRANPISVLVPKTIALTNKEKIANIKINSNFESNNFFEGGSGTISCDHTHAFDASDMGGQPFLGENDFLDDKRFKSLEIILPEVLGDKEILWELKTENNNDAAFQFKYLISKPLQSQKVLLHYIGTNDIEVPITVTVTAKVIGANYQLNPVTFQVYNSTKKHEFHKNLSTPDAPATGNYVENEYGYFFPPEITTDNDTGILEYNRTINITMSIKVALWKDQKVRVVGDFVGISGMENAGKLFTIRTTNTTHNMAYFVGTKERETSGTTLPTETKVITFTMSYTNNNTSPIHINQNIYFKGAIIYTSPIRDIVRDYYDNSYVTREYYFRPVTNYKLFETSKVSFVAKSNHPVSYDYSNDIEFDLSKVKYEERFLDPYNLTNSEVAYLLDHGSIYEKTGLDLKYSIYLELKKLNSSLIWKDDANPANPDNPNLFSNNVIVEWQDLPSGDYTNGVTIRYSIIPTQRSTLFYGVKSATMKINVKATSAISLNTPVSSLGIKGVYGTSPIADNITLVHDTPVEFQFKNYLSNTYFHNKDSNMSTFDSTNDTNAWIENKGVFWSYNIPDYKADYGLETLKLDGTGKLTYTPKIPAGITDAPPITVNIIASISMLPSTVDWEFIPDPPNVTIYPPNLYIGAFNFGAILTQKVVKTITINLH